jgi:formylglycine-generating enzyme required for sulfatase activity
MRVSIPRPEDNFTEKLSDDLELEMIAIPFGEFMMGSQECDQPKLKYDYFFRYTADHDAASPAHRVRLSTFHMSKYPITQAQYQSVMGENPSHSGDLSPNKPVQQVTWNSAQEFCQKLSESTGKIYKLPSESQWEYACRAGTTTRFFFGHNSQFIKKYGHIKTLSHVFFLNKNGSSYNETTSLYGDDHKYTLEINQFKPNPWGLHDLLGNVWEWCQDDWFDGYIGHPSNGSARISEGDLKVVRGGCFLDSQICCYSFSRGFKKIDAVDRTVGFRIVCLS